MLLCPQPPYFGQKALKLVLHGLYDYRTGGLSSPESSCNECLVLGDLLVFSSFGESPIVQLVHYLLCVDLGLSASESLGLINILISGGTKTEF